MRRMVQRIASRNAQDDSLGIGAARGVFWTGGGQILRQIIQIAASLVLARLLSPEDFGLLGMAIAVVGLSQLFADFGIGAAIVQARHVTHTVLATSFWANVMVGGVLLLLLCALAPVVAGFYGDPRVELILMVLSSGLLISALTVVPRSLLFKNLQFGAVAKSQVLGSLCGAGLAVYLAWFGFGVWSLVAQPLTGSLVTASLTLYHAGWWPTFRFRWRRIRRLARFSAAVLGSDILNYAHRNGDDVIIGKALGSGQLGYYSLAYQIMLYPLTQVSSVIVKVLFPTLSRLHQDIERYKNAYLRSVAAIALITFPMMLGLFVVADDFVVVAFGEKWLPMVPVLQILCWVGMVQSIGTTVGTVYLSAGHPEVGFYMTLWSAPCFLIAFMIGVQWGIVGVAWAYAVTATVVVLANYVVVFRLVTIRWSSFIGAVIRPLLVSGAMAALIWIVQWLLITSNVVPHERLLANVTIGAAVYIIGSLIFNRAQVTEVFRLGRAALGGQGSASSTSGAL